MRCFIKDGKTYAFTDEQIESGLSDGMQEISSLAPTSYHTYNGKKWTLTAANKARKLEAEQAIMWEKIKQKREAIRYGGIQVAGKWFHTDDSSRLQYLTLSGLPALPPNLQWKTMDNSFVTMTKELLQQVVATAITAEQTDFTNAEAHRIAMEASANPLDYDFSTGWSEVYDLSGTV